MLHRKNRSNELFCNDKAPHIKTIDDGFAALEKKYEGSQNYLHIINQMCSEKKLSPENVGNFMEAYHSLVKKILKRSNEKYTEIEAISYDILMLAYENNVQTEKELEQLTAALTCVLKANTERTPEVIKELEEIAKTVAGYPSLKWKILSTALMALGLALFVAGGLMFLGTFGCGAPVAAASLVSGIVLSRSGFHLFCNRGIASGVSDKLLKLVHYKTP